MVADPFGNVLQIAHPISMKRAPPAPQRRIEEVGRIEFSPRGRRGRWRWSRAPRPHVTEHLDLSHWSDTALGINSSRVSESSSPGSTSTVHAATLDYLEDLAFISNHTGTPIAAPEDYSAAARELSSVGVWLLRGERVVARWSRKTLTVMGTNAQKVDEVKNGRHMIALENLGTIEIEGRRVPLGPMRTTLLDATMVGEPNWLDASSTNARSSTLGEKRRRCST